VPPFCLARRVPNRKRNLQNFSSFAKTVTKSNCTLRSTAQGINSDGRLTSAGSQRTETWRVHTRRRGFAAGQRGFAPPENAGPNRRTDGSPSRTSQRSNCRVPYCRTTDEGSRPSSR
jgi:hypothetical protein